MILAVLTNEHLDDVGIMSQFTIPCQYTGQLTITSTDILNANIVIVISQDYNSYRIIKRRLLNK